ncbi:30S ribosomal protein S21, chloroplastic-like protein, partial [Tanacetum coccineum]
MASSSPLLNFLSIFTTPFKPSIPPPPSHISLSKDSTFTPLTATSSSRRSSNELMSVVCPSLAYANTLYFRSAYNVQVIVEDNEPEEKLLGRFRREVMKAGVIQECKRRRYFENKQEEKKRKHREAAKRNRR